MYCVCLLYCVSSAVLYIMHCYVSIGIPHCTCAPRSAHSPSHIHAYTYTLILLTSTPSHPSLTHHMPTYPHLPTDPHVPTPTHTYPPHSHVPMLQHYHGSVMCRSLWMHDHLHPYSQTNNDLMDCATCDTSLQCHHARGVCMGGGMYGWYYGWVVHFVWVHLVCRCSLYVVCMQGCCHTIVTVSTQLSLFPHNCHCLYAISTKACTSPTNTTHYINTMHLHTLHQHHAPTQVLESQPPQSTLPIHLRKWVQKWGYLMLMCMGRVCLLWCHLRCGWLGMWCEWLGVCTW